MARKRLVSPQFFTHEELYDAEVASGLPLRLAFEALWCQSDRRGLFVWRPRELKLHCLPYDPCDFSDVLDALETYGFIQSYTVDGKRFGHIPTLTDHQTFHQAEKPDSKIPDPPQPRAKRTSKQVENTQGTPPATSKPSASTVQAQGEPEASTTVAVAVTGTTTVPVAIADAVGGSAPCQPVVDPPAKALREIAHSERPTDRPNNLTGTELQEAELKAAAMPHEIAALEHYASQGFRPAIIGELHAIASGMHVLRGKHPPFREAGAAEVMLAISELASKGRPWDVSYYRGCVVRILDRPPPAPDAAERERRKLEREVSLALPSASQSVKRHADLSPEERAEADRIRTEAMDKFRAEYRRHNPQPNAA